MKRLLFLLGRLRRPFDRVATSRRTRNRCAAAATTNAALKITRPRAWCAPARQPDTRLVVRHEEIPGYMPKMTMELNVRNTNEIAGLERNDEITFQLVATADTHWIQHIKRVGKFVDPETPATRTAWLCLGQGTRTGRRHPGL
jgi:Cu/Ag efflux protein CusF